MSTPTRYRCTACMNLTRFDVTVTRRTQEFHHFSVGGDLTIEEVDLLAEDVEVVACRWCGSTTAVEAVPVPSSTSTPTSTPTSTSEEPGPSQQIQG